jgi:hypothetical protein
MLEKMAKVGDESIVSWWQPLGKAFRVHQPDVFARTVMPRYFKQQTNTNPSSVNFICLLAFIEFRRAWT